MTSIGKENLEKIRIWVVGRMDNQSLARLMRTKPGIFTEKANGQGRMPRDNQEAIAMLTNPHVYGLDLVDSSVENLSFIIQDMLDAMAGKHKMGYQFGGGLPKNYLNQLAKMVEVNNPEKIRKPELVSIVMEKIHQ